MLQGVAVSQWYRAVPERQGRGGVSRLTKVMSTARSPAASRPSSRARSSAVSCHRQGPDVVLQIGAALGAGDGHHVVALGRQPRQRHLARGATVGLCHLLHHLDQGQVVVEVPLVEAGVGAPEVVVGQGVPVGEGAGQHPPAQGAERHEADAELTAGGDDLALQVPGEQGPLALQGGDGVLGRTPAHGVDRRLRQAEVADLAGGHQLAHGADGVLDGDRQVGAVQVVEVDVVHAEAGQ